MAVAGSGGSGIARRAGNSAANALTALPMGAFPRRSRSQASAATMATGSASAR